MVYPSGDDLKSAAWFDEAVQYVRSLPAKPKEGEAEPPTTEQRLAFYALYKQATVGPQPPGARRPGMFDPEGQFKHDAWATLGAIGAEEAKMKYVDLLALVVSTGSEVERRTKGGKGWYANCLAGGATPNAFVQRVLSTPVAELPRLWVLGRDFAAAAASAEAALAGTPVEAQREVTALYFQAMFGDANIARPGLAAGLFATSVSGAEWDAWSALKGTPRDEAISRYLDKLNAAAAS